MRWDVLALGLCCLGTAAQADDLASKVNGLWCNTDNYGRQWQARFSTVGGRLLLDLKGVKLHVSEDNTDTAYDFSSGDSSFDDSSLFIRGKAPVRWVNAYGGLVGVCNYESTATGFYAGDSLTLTVSNPKHLTAPPECTAWGKQERTLVLQRCFD